MTSVVDRYFTAQDFAPGDALDRATATFIASIALPSDPTGCVLWLKPVDRYGYGKLKVRYGPAHLRLRNYIGAHRFAYLRFVGPIQRGRVLDHLCNTPACVNPTHLEVVTQAENVRRSAARRRTLAA